MGEVRLPPQFPRSLWAITKNLLRINKCRIEKIRKELACREFEYLENAGEWRQRAVLLEGGWQMAWDRGEGKGKTILLGTGIKLLQSWLFPGACEREGHGGNNEADSSIAHTLATMIP